MNKVCLDAAAAVRDVPDGAVIAFGGFGLCGVPENAIAALVAQGAKDLVCIGNNAGIDDVGVGHLVSAGRVRKIIASFIGENKSCRELVARGVIELELVPQGTLVERLRAGGAGIPAFYTPTGVGTEVAEGKEVRTFDGRPYLLEHALVADYAFVRAWRGDRFGNVVFRKTARNYNPVVATAARVTIVEVEELVPVGALDPNDIHLPGIYVERMFVGASRRLEKVA